MIYYVFILFLTKGNQIRILVNKVVKSYLNSFYYILTTKNIVLKNIFELNTLSCYQILLTKITEIWTQR